MADFKHTVGEFISHCDDPGCSLGRFEYECPLCHVDCVDYQQVWWDRDYIVCGDLRKEFECDRCAARLVAYWDSKEFETRVEVRL